MDPQVRQPLQGVGQLPRGEGPAFVPVGDISVLAIDTAERAAGKKDSPVTSGAANGRLLPQVRRGTGNEHLLPQAAETGAFSAVHTALPGT